MGKLLVKLMEEEAQKMQLRSGYCSSQKQGANQEENKKIESGLFMTIRGWVILWLHSHKPATSTSK